MIQGIVTKDMLELLSGIELEALQGYLGGEFFVLSGKSPGKIAQ